MLLVKVTTAARLAMLSEALTQYVENQPEYDTEADQPVHEREQLAEAEAVLEQVNLKYAECAQW